MATTPITYTQIVALTSLVTTGGTNNFGAAEWPMGISLNQGQVYEVSTTYATKFINAGQAIAWDSTALTNPKLPPVIYTNVIHYNSSI